MSIPFNEHGYKFNDVLERLDEKYSDAQIWGGLFWKLQRVLLAIVEIVEPTSKTSEE